MLVVSGLWWERFDEFMDGMVEVYECIPGLFKCRGHPDVLMRRPRHCWPTEQENENHNSQYEVHQCNMLLIMFFGALSVVIKHI